MKSLLVRLVSSTALSVVALFSTPAAAHDKWLEVDPFIASGAPNVKLYLVTGEALQKPELLPIRQKNRVARFQLLTASGKRELLPMLREDQQPITALTSGTLPQGTSVVVLDTTPIDILLGAEKFQAYLFEEQLIDILMDRADRREEDVPGRERYSRSMKALVQVGKKHDEIATRPVGQDLEIVPTVNPYSLSVGGKLVVQVLWRGQPLPKRAVTFANRHHSNVIQKSIRADGNGYAALPLDRSGGWLVSLVHMERSRESGADWRSYWSSLTFELPEATP